MTTYTGNYAWQNPKCKDGDIFEKCNLSQHTPGTKIGLKDEQPVKGLMFRQCNLVNCAPPDDAVVEDCNTAQVDFCTHLEPELILHGRPACVDACDHRVSDELQWQSVHEDEFRATKADIGAAATVRVSKTEDALGVVIDQRFERLGLVYEHKVLPEWKPAKDREVEP